MILMNLFVAHQLIVVFDPYLGPMWHDQSKVGNSARCTSSCAAHFKTPQSHISKDQCALIQD